MSDDELASFFLSVQLPEADIYQAICRVLDDHDIRSMDLCHELTQVVQSKIKTSCCILLMSEEDDD